MIITLLKQNTISKVLTRQILPLYVAQGSPKAIVIIVVVESNLRSTRTVHWGGVKTVNQNIYTLISICTSSLLLKLQIALMSTHRPITKSLKHDRTVSHW